MDNVEMIDRLISEIPLRMINLKKYYPYFNLYRLNTSSSKYSNFDIGSIILGILGYLLYEVEIKRRNVMYTELYNFLNVYTSKLYLMTWEEVPLKDFVDYILNKLQNEGSPFYYEFYNFSKQKMDEHYIRYISYTYNEKENVNHYQITADGIDFYLQTKEFGEESKITIHLLLLKKLIDDNDYDSALTQIINVNTEVRKQIIRKKDIVDALMANGIKAYDQYEEYKNNVMKRFEEERELFDATKVTVDSIFDNYLRQIDSDTITKKEKNVIKILEKIKEELKNTIEIHGVLIQETLNLTKQSESILQEKRVSSFREKFNFQNFLQGVSRLDNVVLTKSVIDPLLSPNIKKFLSIDKLEDMDLCKEKTKQEEAVDVVSDDCAKDYVSLDNIIEGRLINNYRVFLNLLFSFLNKTNECKTTEYIQFIKDNLNPHVVGNPDFHTFLLQFYNSGNGSVSTFPTRYHDLREYLLTHNKMSMEKQKYYMGQLIAEIIMEIDGVHNFKTSRIEICPDIKEYISINPTTSITNYNIRRVEI